MTSASSAKETAAKIKALLQEIPNEERADAARLDELRQVLSSLIQQGDLTFAASNNDHDATLTKWNSWLQKQHKETVAQLTSRMIQGRRTAVRTLWGLVAASPQVTAQGHAHVSAELLYQWVSALVTMPLEIRQDKPLKHLLEAEWNQRDVQYYALRCMTRWATERYHSQKQQPREDEKKKKKKRGEDDLTEQADRMMFFLMMIPFPTTQGALDMSDNKYMFPPPTGPSKHHGSYDDASDNEDNDNDNDNNSSDDEEEDSDDKDGEPPNKKQRRTASKKHFAYQDVKCHLSALAKAWLALLRLPLSTSSLKKALPYLSQHVLPKINDPLRFSDLFIKAYRGATGHDDDTQRHANTIIPLVALDGLFYLMTQHQLEYPHFYAQLYALLKPKLFFVKYRQRFLELLQKCLLRNEMLPAHLVAAFVKRLLHCALQAPPAGTLVVLALCSNLLRGHEECAALLHRTSMPHGDPYDPATDDPVQSKALQSSLWELQALEQHYLPAVATLAHSLGREDPKAPYWQLEEMAQQSYATLIAQERKRNTKGKKNTTPVTFTKPTALFTQDDVFAEILHVPISFLPEQP